MTDERAEAVRDPEPVGLFNAKVAELIAAQVLAKKGIPSTAFESMAGNHPGGLLDVEHVAVDFY